MVAIEARTGMVAKVPNITRVPIIIGMAAIVTGAMGIQEKS